MGNKEVACWISDHPPTPEQIEYLDNLGYSVLQLRSPHKRRWNSAEELYAAMRKRCSPSIIIMVLPSMGLGSSLLEKVGNIPVYQADMEFIKGKWEWKGTWSKINGTRYLKSREDIPSVYGEANG